MIMTKETRRTWAEIHLDRLAHNYRLLRERAPHSKFVGLVKANAYGHGAVPVAKKLEALGADYLAVACLDEAEQLRDAGIKCPILVLGYTPVEYTNELIDNDITQTVYSLEVAKGFSDAAMKLGKKLRCHLKADTGMSRLGVLCTLENLDAAADELEAMYRQPGLEVEGLFQHFADADTCPEYSLMQIQRYNAILHALEERGCTFKLRHCCAGAATLNYPQAHYDMIRPGILLYGYSPDHACDGMIDVKPVMEVKSRIGSVKKLPKGTCISYGRTYLTPDNTSTAIVPLGYADGIHRSASGFDMEGAKHVEKPGGPVRIMTTEGPKIYRVCGRVCMDQFIVDLHGSAAELGVHEGDTVELFGPGRGEDYVEPTADDWARAADTISYEIFTCLRNRIPRLYEHAAEVLPAADLAKLDPATLL